MKNFLLGSVFMVCFGLVDNIGMWVGFVAVEDYLQSLGYPPLISAMLGNTFSDQLGILFGGSISYFLYKLLKVKDNEVSLKAQFFGITVGCLIPVFVKVLIDAC